MDRLATVDCSNRFAFSIQPIAELVLAADCGWKRYHFVDVLQQLGLGFVENPGFRHDFLHFLAGVLGQYLWLVCRSWIVGFVLGAVSRGMLAINGTLFCLMLVCGEFVNVPRLLEHWLFFQRARDFDPNAVVFTVTFYRVILPALVQIALVLLPSYWGMRQDYSCHLLGHLSEKVW